jgi:hypothetical protein
MNRFSSQKRILAGSLILLSAALAFRIFLPSAEIAPRNEPAFEERVLNGSGAVMGDQMAASMNDATDGDEPGAERNMAANVPPVPETTRDSQQKVFRLILEDGACRLDAIEDVIGDFRARRGTEELHAGMIVCRLVGANDVVLAEERVHAPDHVCAVLDPNAGPDGPKVALLAGMGPQVFQVRFPSSLAGDRLEVFRVTRTVPEISRTLLLTLPINP